MSQRNVESFLGRLATDRDLRKAFAAEPRRALDSYRGEGHELAAVEVDALLSLDVEALARFADTLDARIRRLGPTGAFDVSELRRNWK